MSAFFREVLWQRLKRNRMAMAGAAIVLTMFLLALLASMIGRDPCLLYTSPSPRDRS